MYADGVFAKARAPLQPWRSVLFASYAMFQFCSVGEELAVDASSSSYFLPLTSTCTAVQTTIYSSIDPDPVSTNDPGMVEEGRVFVTIPPSRGEARPVESASLFGMGTLLKQQGRESLG